MQRSQKLSQFFRTHIKNSEKAMRRRRGRMRNVQTARRSVRSFVKRLSFVEFAIHFVCAASKMLSIDGANSGAAQKYATLLCELLCPKATEIQTSWKKARFSAFR